MRKTDFIWICMAAESLGSSSWELERAKRDYGFLGRRGKVYLVGIFLHLLFCYFFLNCAVRIHVIYRNTVTANLCESIYMKWMSYNEHVCDRALFD